MTSKVTVIQVQEVPDGYEEQVTKAVLDTVMRQFATDEDVTAVVVVPLGGHDAFMEPHVHFLKCQTCGCGAYLKPWDQGQPSIESGAAVLRQHEDGSSEIIHTVLPDVTGREN